MSLTYLLGDESSSDTITTEGGDPIFLFSLGSTHAVEYALDVDWDGDSAYNGDNEADYLLRFDISRGRERLIGAPGQGFEPYRVGRAVFELDNSSGRFNPWNAEGDLYGNIEPGKLMTFRAAVYSTDGDGHITYDIFTGFVSDIQPEGWNKTVNIVCEDGLGMLTKDYEMFATVFSDGISTVMDEYASMAEYPFGQSFSTDDPTTDRLGYISFIANTPLLNEFEDICSASLGSFACEGDGTLAYHSIYESDTSILALDDALVLDSPFIPTPWDNLRAGVTINAGRLVFIATFDGEDPTVYLSEYAYNPITIGAESSFTAWLPYYLTTYPSTDSHTTNLIASTGMVDTGWVKTAYFAPGSISTGDLVPSSDYDIDITTFIQKAMFEITNTSTSGIYLSEINQNQSAGIYDIKFDAVNAGKYQFGSTSYSWANNDFIIKSNNFNAILIKFEDQLQDYPPYTASQQARIEKLGNLLYNYLSTPRYHPTLQMQGRPSYQWLLDVEKKITYTSAQLGIDEDFRVCGLRHQTNGENPQDVLTTIYLYPVIPSST